LRCDGDIHYFSQLRVRLFENFIFDMSFLNLVGSTSNQQNQLISMQLFAMSNLQELMFKFVFLIFENFALEKWNRFLLHKRNVKKPMVYPGFESSPPCLRVKHRHTKLPGCPGMQK
jgi:hypothetical protein